MGCINSYWLLVMLIMCLIENDKDYVIIGVVLVEVEGLVYIYGC